MSYVGLWFILCLIVGSIGHNRSIGFWLSFLVSLILSPIVGLIFVLLSKSNQQARLEELLFEKERENLTKDQEFIDTIKDLKERKLANIESMKDHGQISSLEYKMLKQEILKGN